MTADSTRSYTEDELVRDYTLAWTGQGDASHSWASDELDYLAREQPERGWPVILSLIAGSPSDQFLAIVAAGPLEDLLCEHGPAFITRADRRLAGIRIFVMPWPEFGVCLGCLRTFTRGCAQQSEMRRFEMTFLDVAPSPPNQAMQRTAGRAAFALSMTSTLNPQPHAPSPAVADLGSR